MHCTYDSQWEPTNCRSTLGPSPPSATSTSTLTLLLFSWNAQIVYTPVEIVTGAKNNSHLVSKVSRTRPVNWSPCPSPSRPPSQWLQQPDHQPAHIVPQRKCNWQTYPVSDDAPDHLVSFLQEGQHWLLVRHPVRLKRVKGKMRKDVETWINSSSGIQSQASSMVSSRQLEKM